MVDELALASVLLAAVALISCLSVDNKRAIRRLPRGWWVVVILLVPMVGPVAWFVAGRPLAIRARQAGWRRLPGLGRQPAGPAAPDDDADFLRSLDQPEGKEEPRRRPESGDPEPDEPRRPDPEPDN